VRRSPGPATCLLTVPRSKGTVYLHRPATLGARLDECRTDGLSTSRSITGRSGTVGVNNVALTTVTDAAARRSSTRKREPAGGGLQRRPVSAGKNAGRPDDRKRDAQTRLARTGEPRAQTSRTVAFELPALGEGSGRTVRIEIDDDLASTTSGTSPFCALRRSTCCWRMATRTARRSWPKPIFSKRRCAGAPGETYADTPFRPIQYRWTKETVWATSPPRRSSSWPTWKVHPADARPCPVRRSRGRLLVFTGDRVIGQEGYARGAGRAYSRRNRRPLRAHDLPFRFEQWDETHPLFERSTIRSTATCAALLSQHHRSRPLPTRRWSPDFGLLERWGRDGDWFTSRAIANGATGPAAVVFAVVHQCSVTGGLRAGAGARRADRLDVALAADVVPACTNATAHRSGERRAARVGTIAALEEFAIDSTGAPQQEPLRGPHAERPGIGEEAFQKQQPRRTKNTAQCHIRLPEVADCAAGVRCGPAERLPAGGAPVESMADSSECRIGFRSRGPAFTTSVKPSRSYTPGRRRRQRRRRVDQHVAHRPPPVRPASNRAPGGRTAYNRLRSSRPFAIRTPK